MSLLDLIFPKTCLSCGREGKYMCDSCISKAKILKPVCPYCEKPSIDGFTHSKCGRINGLDGLTSVWDYDGIIKKAILALKFKYSTEVGKELTIRIIEWLNDHIDLIPTRALTGQTLLNSSILIPIPIHWRRENVRGFNQSIEIGRDVAREMGWKFIPDLLVKKQQTVSQVELSVEKRKQNLQSAFVINPSILISQYSSILLFDDVFTTGSTLKEAAKVFKKAGVAKVCGMTIAR